MTPEQEQALSSRIETLEIAVDGLRQIEPTLKVFTENIDFFMAIISALDPRLKAIENVALEATPVRLKTLETVLESLNISTLVTKATAAVQHSIHDDLKAVQKSMDDFRRDATALYATKNELLSKNHAPDPAAHKGKMALPDAFSGKRDDWKVFASHLFLYLTANAAAYPTDSDKILFAVSRLGDGSAFKYMMQFIPKLKGPVALRPAIITDFDTFLDTMKETFGVQNANVVAETQLLQLQQKGSAVDYTNKFQELSSDLEWNDSALIAHYRRGHKIDVIRSKAQVHDRESARLVRRQASMLDARATGDGWTGDHSSK